jgi:hypothetical protein
MMRPWLAGVFAGALGCSPLPLLPFELDVSSNCNEVAVEPIFTDLDEMGGENWTRVLAAAADAPGSDSAWLLVVAQRDFADRFLAVGHLAPDGFVLVEELPQEVSAGDDLSFIVGPGRGQAWLVDEAPGVFQLRRYEADPVPVRLAVSPNFSNFPAGLMCEYEDGVAPCMVADWVRELVFFDAAPYLLSLPPSSGDSSVDLIVGVLDSNLDLQRQETLNFAPDCDPELAPADLAACEAIKASMVHPTIAFLGIQPDTRPGTTSLALYRETLTLVEGAPDTPQADVAFVVLGHDKLGRPAGNLVSEPTLYAPAGPEDGAVVIDSRAMYVQYDSGVSPVIVQKAALDDRFDTLTDDLDLEMFEDSTLLQLDEDIALGRIVDGAWEIVKLFPDAPDASRVTLHEAGSELERVVFAGPGSFLLHEADGGPDLVRLRCSDDPPQAE